jgi:hypothetical protein
MGSRLQRATCNWSWLPRAFGRGAKELLAVTSKDLMQGLQVLLEWAPKCSNRSRLVPSTMWCLTQPQPMISQGTRARQKRTARRGTIFSAPAIATCGSLIQPQIYRKLECDAPDGKSRYITAACRRGNSELPCVCSRFTLPGLEELPCRGLAEGLTRAPRTVPKTHLLRGHDSPSPVGSHSTPSAGGGSLKSWNLSLYCRDRPGFQSAFWLERWKVRHENFYIFGKIF